MCSIKSTLTAIHIATKSLSQTNIVLQIEMGKNWSFRPTALRHLIRYFGETVFASTFFECYDLDNRHAKEVEVPPRDSDVSNKAPIFGLRTCQWNVHYFSDNEDRNGLAEDIAVEILKVDADVIVLNEFGVSGIKQSTDFHSSSSSEVNDPADIFARKLEAKGYSIFCATCCYPTVSHSSTRLSFGLPVSNLNVSNHS